MSENLANGSVYDQYPGLKQFLDNYKVMHHGEGGNTKNLYVIQSIDRDGNVTAEHYGLNLMTDTGVDVGVLGWTNTSNLSYVFYLVEGVSEAADIRDYAFPTYTRRVRQIDYTWLETLYPMEFDSETGIITQDCQRFNVSFDYNYSDIDSDMTINCIVYCQDHGSNFTYVPLIKVTTYDVNGMASPIIKHLDEKIVMKVFIRVSMHEDALINGYNAGQYILINPARAAMPLQVDSYDWRISRWSCSDTESYETTASNSQRDRYQSIGTNISGQRFIMQNGEAYTLQRANNIILSDPRVYASRILIDYGSWNYYGNWVSAQCFQCFNELKMTSSEEISIETVYTNNITSPLLSNAFGMQAFSTYDCSGIIPVVDFTITSVKGYNYTTHAWDIDIPFIDAPYATYDNPFCLAIPELGVEGGEISSWGNYVYINPRAITTAGRPAVPITALRRASSGTIYPMYATDKYWDKSAWTLIQDLSNIPVAQQTKKYYISNGGSNGYMIPTYDQTVHSLNVGTSYTVQNTPSDFMKKTVPTFKPIVDYTNGWILGQEHLMFMDGKDIEYAYRLTGPEYFQIYYDAERWAANWDKYYIKSGNNYVLNESSTYNSSTTYYSNRIDRYTIRYGFGNKILVASDIANPAYTYPTKVRLYTISSRSTTPTYTDIDIDTDTTDISRPGMYSASSNGFFVIQDRQTHCANIITISDATVEKLENIDMCFALEYTDYCVYRDLNEVNTVFVVYNMRTKAVVNTFSLDAAYASVTYIFGWHEFVYIKSVGSGSTTYCNMYNILTGELTLTTIPVTNNQFNTAYNSSETSFRTESESFRLNQFECQLYSEDVMVIIPTNINTVNTASKWYIKYNDPTNAYDLFKHGVITERQIESWYEQNNYRTLYEGSLATTLVHAVQSPQQSKLLLVDTYSSRPSSWQYLVNNETSFFACVSDIGPIVDTNVSGNMCPSHGTVSDNSYYHGGLAYWAGGIIRFMDSGATWYPLEWFIHSKVTGDTYTIQSVNNPKKIGKCSFVQFKTNRGPNLHSNTPVIRSTGDIEYVFKHDDRGYNAETKYRGYHFMKRLNAEVIGYYQNRQSVPANTVIRVEVVPADGFEFLVGTFRWWTSDIGITETDTNVSVSIVGVSPETIADDKDQLNGGSVTLTSTVPIFGLTITSNSAELGDVLEPSMIKSIKITTDPHIST